MHKIFLFFFLVLDLSNANAQNTAIDSLKKVLKTEKDDTNKVNTLNSLSSKLLNINYDDDAFVYAKDALNLAEKINFKKGAAAAYLTTGMYFFFVAENYPEALKNAFAASKLYEGTGNKKVSECLLLVGTIYKELGEDSLAMKNLTDALNGYKAIKDSAQVLIPIM